MGIIGARFGRLTVLEKSGVKESFCKTENRVKKRNIMKCICDCGKEVHIQRNSLTTKITQSCGCLRREKLLELNHSKRNPESGINSLMARYLIEARKRGYIFELTYEEFKEIINQNCTYCGVEPYQFHTSWRGVKTLYNGIDRVNPLEGYYIGNVVPCCGKCNFMKCDLTRDDFINICRRIVMKEDGNPEYKNISDNRKTAKQRNGKLSLSSALSQL